MTNDTLEIYQAKRFDMKFWTRPHTSDVKSIAEVVDRNGYQRKDFKILPGETWFDIGGYIGSFACTALRLGACVEIFEPFDSSRDLLEKNLALNNLVGGYVVHPFALTAGDIPSERSMGINKNGNLWRNSIVKTPAQGGSVPVRCEPITHHIGRAQCVKMDVEGSELELLGDVSIYRHLKKLVFEWGFDVDPSIERFINKCDELKGIFQHVKHATFAEGEKIHHWFPPCTKVFCWND